MVLDKICMIFTSLYFACESSGRATERASTIPNFILSTASQTSSCKVTAAKHLKPAFQVKVPDVVLGADSLSYSFAGERCSPVTPWRRRRRSSCSTHFALPAWRGRQHLLTKALSVPLPPERLRDVPNASPSLSSCQSGLSHHRRRPPPRPPTRGFLPSCLLYQRDLHLKKPTVPPLC